MIHHPTRLYHQLIKFAGQYGGWSDLRHLGVMCWMMVGLIADGFNLESSMLRCAPALSRLCLVLAMTTMFLTATGVEVVKTAQRRLVDPHWFRGSSYLKIGWSWVKKALIHGWNLPHLIFLTANIDPVRVASALPNPVKASSPKHDLITYSIQFTARTHIWFY